MDFLAEEEELEPTDAAAEPPEEDFFVDMLGSRDQMFLCVRSLVRPTVTSLSCSSRVVSFHDLFDHLHNCEQEQQTGTAGATTAASHS